MKTKSNGCSHLKRAAALVIERNLPPVTPNKPQKIGLLDPGIHQIIERNQIQDGGHLVST
jgi:hypothetical protein